MQLANGDFVCTVTDIHRTQVGVDRPIRGDWRCVCTWWNLDIRQKCRNCKRERLNGQSDAG